MSGKQTAKAPRGSKLLPALCRLFGTLILLAVILTALPLSVPRWFGMEPYFVETGSMAPSIPQGSVVYIRPADAAQIAAGDVIAYRADGAVVIHRVVQNRTVEGKFITQGDANTVEDAPVSYAALVGRMEWHLPLLGNLLSLYATTLGKIYALLLAASGVMFYLLAGCFRARSSAQLRRDLARDMTAPPDDF